MIGVALKGLLGRKLRAVLTAVSIVLGVAMISGTFILTDTINKGFTTIFTESYKNTSAVITARSTISSSNSGAALTGGFPSSVLDQVQRLPDVAAAAGSMVTPWCASSFGASPASIWPASSGVGSATRIG